MPRGFLSAKIDATNPLHHLWRNNGSVWWIHYTLHFDHRKRRIRRSLKTTSVGEAIRRRDTIFARLALEGEDVPERPWQRSRRGESDGWTPWRDRQELFSAGHDSHAIDRRHTGELQGFSLGSRR